jgi:hypothetical protein
MMTSTLLLQYAQRPCTCVSRAARSHGALVIVFYLGPWLVWYIFPPTYIQHIHCSGDHFQLHGCLVPLHPTQDTCMYRTKHRPERNALSSSMVIIFSRLHVRICGCPGRVPAHVQKHTLTIKVFLQHRSRPVRPFVFAAPQRDQCSAP